MIISASRRTDIPNYYSDWFFNRLKEGFLYVRNPMFIHQVSKINLDKELIDCIVFWTKNPSNMIDRLDELDGYNYYFQFSVTGYGNKIEPGIPSKTDVIIPVFKRLSKLIGKNRVIWRYDPILLNEQYHAEYHIRAFEKIARELHGYTERVVISFVDLYKKTKSNTKNAGIDIWELTDDQMIRLAESMAQIAKKFDLEIESCAEKIDLESVGVRHGCCIDKSLIEQIIGYSLKGSKDKNQREECGCFESIEIGSYDTCKNNCRYCYANLNDNQVSRKAELYDPNSPLLCGEIGPHDRVTERKIKSLKADISDSVGIQTDMFNMIQFRNVSGVDTED